MRRSACDFIRCSSSALAWGASTGGGVDGSRGIAAVRGGGGGGAIGGGAGGATGGGGGLTVLGGGGTGSFTRSGGAGVGGGSSGTTTEVRGGAAEGAGTRRSVALTQPPSGRVSQASQIGGRMRISVSAAARSARCLDPAAIWLRRYRRAAARRGTRSTARCRCRPACSCSRA